MDGAARALRVGGLEEAAVETSTPTAADDIEEVGDGAYSVSASSGEDEREARRRRSWHASAPPGGDGDCGGVPAATVSRRRRRHARQHRKHHSRRRDSTGRNALEIFLPLEAPAGAEVDDGYAADGGGADDDGGVSTLGTIPPSAYAQKRRGDERSHLSRRSRRDTARAMVDTAVGHSAAPLGAGGNLVSLDEYLLHGGPRERRKSAPATVMDIGRRSNEVKEETESSPPTTAADALGGLSGEIYAVQHGARSAASASASMFVSRASILRHRFGSLTSKSRSTNAPKDEALEREMDRLDDAEEEEEGLFVGGGTVGGSMPNSVTEDDGKSFRRSTAFSPDVAVNTNNEDKIESNSDEGSDGSFLDEIYDSDSDDDGVEDGARTRTSTLSASTSGSALRFGAFFRRNALSRSIKGSAGVTTDDELIKEEPMSILNTLLTRDGVGDDVEVLSHSHKDGSVVVSLSASSAHDALKAPQEVELGLAWWLRDIEEDPALNEIDTETLGSLVENFDTGSEGGPRDLDRDDRDGAKDSEGPAGKRRRISHSLRRRRRDKPQPKREGGENKADAEFESGEEARKEERRDKGVVGVGADVSPKEALEGIVEWKESGEVDGEDDDISVASTAIEDRYYPGEEMDLREEKDLDRWEERLWAAARAHWDKRYGNGDHGDATDDDNEEDSDDTWLLAGPYLEDEAVTVATGLGNTAAETVASAYRGDDERTRRGVIKFRSLMSKCLAVYAAVFHRQPDDSLSQVDGSMGNGGGSIEEDKGCGGDGDKIPVGTAPPPPFLDVDLELNHYVPLSVVLPLFVEVIHRELRGLPEEEDREQRPGPQEEVKQKKDHGGVNAAAREEVKGWISSLFEWQRPPPNRDERGDQGQAEHGAGGAVDCLAVRRSAAALPRRILERTADRVVDALLGPELGAFRRYRVEYLTTSPAGDDSSPRNGGGTVAYSGTNFGDGARTVYSDFSGGSGKPERRVEAARRWGQRHRVRKGHTEGREDEDIENFLYADMHDKEKEKKEDEDGSKDMSASAMSGTKTTLDGRTEGEEEEIRLRTGMVRKVLRILYPINKDNEKHLQSENAITADVCDIEEKWKQIFTNDVLIHSILELDPESLLGRKPKEGKGEGRTEDEGLRKFLAKTSPLRVVMDPSARTDGSAADIKGPSVLSLSRAYAVRYAPKFLLRAAATAAIGGAACEAAISAEKILLAIFCAPKAAPIIFGERIALLGPYDGALLHLEDWNAVVRLREWRMKLMFYQQQKMLSKSLKATDVDMPDDSGNHLAFHQQMLGALSNLLAVEMEELKGDDESKLGRFYAPHTSKKKKKGVRRVRAHESKIDTSKMVTFFVEVGRALHEMGVRLGRTEWERASHYDGMTPNSSLIISKLDASGGDSNTQTDVKGSFDTDTANTGAETVTVEVLAYQDADMAYRAALEMLKNAEQQLIDDMKMLDEDEYGAKSTGKRKEWKKKRHRPRSRRDQALGNNAHWNEMETELHHVRESKIAIELHLADTLMCLAFCYDTKLAKYELGLHVYKEASTLYKRHVGRDHLIVSNALHNMGTIHVTLQQFEKAAGCYRECLTITRMAKPESDRGEVELMGDDGMKGTSSEKNKKDRYKKADRTVEKKQPKPALEMGPASLVSREDEEIAQTLRCLAGCYIEIGDYDLAVQVLRESIERMRLVASSLGTPLPVIPIKPDKIDEETDENGTSVTIVNNCIGTIVDHRHRFVADTLSTLAGLHMEQSHVMWTRWHNQNTQKIFPGLSDGLGRNGDEDLAVAVSLSRWIQLERGAVDCLEEAITLRKLARLSVTKGNGDNSDKVVSSDEHTSDVEIAECLAAEAMTDSFIGLQLVEDLIKLGVVRFRLRFYSEAIVSFAEAWCVLSGNTYKDNIWKDVSTLSSLEIANMFKFPRPLETELDAVAIRILNLLSTSFQRLDRHSSALAILISLVNVPKQRRHHLGFKRSQGFGRSEVDINLSLAHAHLKIGHISFEMVDFRSATKHFKQALQLFDEAIFDENLHAEEVVEMDASGSCVDVSAGVVGGGGKKSSQDLSMKGEASNIKSSSAYHAICINSDMGFVMYSMGRIYHDRLKNDRALKFFNDAIHLYEAAQRKTLALYGNRDLSPGDRSTFKFLASMSAGVGPSSLMTMMAVGDAHYRAGQILLEREKVDEAFRFFERSIEVTECLIAEGLYVSLRDEENDIERVKMDEIEDRLMMMYDILLPLIDIYGEWQQTKNVSYGVAGRGRFHWGLWKTRSNEQTNGEIHFTREDILFRQGNNYAKRSDHNAAISCYNEAEKLTVERLGTRDHIIVSNIVHNLGQVYSEIYRDACMSSLDEFSGDIDAKIEAIKCFEEVIRISQLTHGFNHMSVSESLQHLAMIYTTKSSLKVTSRSEEDDKKTMECLEQSLQIRYSLDQDKSLDAAALFHLLGVLYLRESDSNIDMTMDVLGTAISIRRMMLGSDHLDVAETLCVMGKAHQVIVKTTSEQGDIVRKHEHIELALKAFTEVVRVRNHHWIEKVDQTKQDKGRIVSLSGMGEVLFDIAVLLEEKEDLDSAKIRFEEAKSRFEEALKQTNNRNRGSEHLTHTITRDGTCTWLAKIWYHLGRINMKTGHIGKSIECFTESLKQMGADDSNVKMEEIDIAEVCKVKLSMASVFEKLSRHNEAIEMYDWSLEHLRKSRGNDSEEVASILKLMGYIHLQQHNFSDAEVCLREAVRIFDNDDGNFMEKLEAPERGLLHNNFGRVLSVTPGKEKESLHQFRLAVSFKEECQGMISEGHYQSLLACYEEMLRLTRAVLKEGEIESEEEIHDILHRIGNLHAVLGEHSRALECFRRVLQFQHRLDGDKNLAVADILFNMGNTYFAMHELSRAFNCHNAYQQISTDVLGEENIDLAENMFCLGNVTSQQLDFDAALHWYDGALRLYQRQGDNNSSTVAMIFHRR